MTYPELTAVETASHFQLAKWARHLPSPGMSAVARDEHDFEVALVREAAIMDRIMVRFREAGGWTPELSKAVGWD
ncbi:hypothetical protein CcrColossus_gp199 [Caulobacter phage CcrColossus]|uniref:Uncharacterized protein n=1 Tax=Caulobacter phage CcrColossus TaxID=1211640 RepID=K4JRV8_9CAUD|nr:hypothetical protein CcrColossus_gp199 [Caulobacter phage CcrColossus]AFU88069.1 hypothetical protein CcrColossus_gp199 [Caulobacter phage CcrColossus]